MLKNDIGINAGTIWQMLSEKGSLSIKEIEEMTGYNDSMMLFALGWLAKENKIYFLHRKGSLYIELSNALSENFY